MVNVKTRFCPIDTEQEKSGIAALLVLASHSPNHYQQGDIILITQFVITRQLKTHNGEKSSKVK